jgi:CRP-like cAMP-binding protein
MRTSEVAFKIVESAQCPYYARGDLFVLSGNALLLELQQEKSFVTTAIIRPPLKKQTCRILIADITRALIQHGNVDRLPETPIECSGCSGKVRLEPVRRGVPTDADGTGDRTRNIDSIADLLSNFSIFQSLDKNDLKDVVSFLRVKKYSPDSIVLQKGSPAQNLYIILSGAADVLDAEGVRLSTLERGDVFGEMSLIGDQPVGATVKVVKPATIIFIKGRDFKNVLNKFPSIQMYLARLLAQRLAKSNITVAEEIASGMIGRLTEMPPSELFQTLNLNQKTGKLALALSTGTGELTFMGGELIRARYNELEGEEAFYALLKARDGRFKFSPKLTRAEQALPPVGPFMELLLEGLRRIDEDNSSSEAAAD